MASGLRRRQMDELVLGRKFGVDDAGPKARLAQELGQAMIALRADDDIDRRLAAQDFRPLGLGDAAGDNQRHPPALRAARSSLSSRSLPSSE